MEGPAAAISRSSGEAGDVVVDVTGAVAAPGRLPAAGREPGRRRGPARRRRHCARRSWKRSTSPRGWPTASRSWCRSGGRAGAAVGGRGGRRRRADQPRHGDGRAARHDRRASARSPPKTSSSSATNTAASPRSTSSTRSPGSARRRWRRCAHGCSRSAGRCARRARRCAVLVGIVVLVAVALAHSGEIRARAAAGLGRGHAGARGGARARLRPRRGRGNRRGDGGRLPPLRAQPSAGGLRARTSPCSRCWRCRLLGALGIPLRERLLWVLGLIAVYVPLAGSGPSIQRAAVMGAAGLLATLAGRRASRLYALALALGVTLAVDPGVAADVGWQLSFAAVLGILLLARAAAGLVGAAARARALARERWREGLAVTVAATLATAPLIAFHFEDALDRRPSSPTSWRCRRWRRRCGWGWSPRRSPRSRASPVEPLNGVNALLLAYIAQVAAWCGGAELGRGPRAARAGGGWLPRTWGSQLRRRGRRGSRGRCGSSEPAGVCAAPAPGLAEETGSRRAGGGWTWGSRWASAPRGGWRRGPGPLRRRPIVRRARRCGRPIRRRAADRGARRRPGRRDPAAAARRAGPARRRRPAGRRSRGEAARRRASTGSAPRSSPTTSPTTPPAIEELLGRAADLPARLRPSRTRRSLAAARAAGARPDQVAAGADGPLRRAPASKSSGRRRNCSPRPLGGDDPNDQALVILARWRDFSMLLTADAEAEAVPIDPGPIDVLKVAHHGSDDAGLGPLLDRIRPRLAVISVGADNTYGHPTAGTLATLAAHRVPSPAHRPGRDRRRSTSGAARSQFTPAVRGARQVPH